MIDQPLPDKPRKLTLKQLTDNIDEIRHLVAQMPGAPFETTLCLNVRAQHLLSLLDNQILGHFRAHLLSMSHVRHHINAPNSLN